MCLLCSYGFISLFQRTARGLGLIDRPNDRSSHKQPTVKGGGVVFSSVFLFFLLLFYLWVPGFKAASAMVLIVCPLVLIVGWLDDRFNLSALVRLFIHLVLSGLIISYLSNGLEIEFQLLFLPPNQWLNIVFTLLFLGWFTNLYNFMDGADGMAAGTGMVASALLGGLSFYAGAHELGGVYLLLAAAIAGFIPWNWSPARIFMGESGSYFLGITFATLALVGKLKYDLSLYPTIVVFGLFIVDPTFTLIVRVSRGENPLRAHRHFAFHKMLKMGWSHSQVSAIYLAICGLWLGPLAYACLKINHYSFLILVVAYLPLVCYVAKVKAGRD